jgi:hypothetical protein
MSLPAATRITVAQVPKDAVIVLEMPNVVSVDQAARIQEDIQLIWPGRKALVISGGATLKIVERV